MIRIVGGLQIGMLRLIPETAQSACPLPAGTSTPEGWPPRGCRPGGNASNGGCAVQDTREHPQDR